MFEMHLSVSDFSFFRVVLTSTLVSPDRWVLKYNAGDLLVTGGTFWEVEGNVYATGGKILQQLARSRLGLIGFSFCVPPITFTIKMFFIVVFNEYISIMHLKK